MRQPGKCNTNKTVYIKKLLSNFRHYNGNIGRLKKKKETISVRDTS